MDYQIIPKEEFDRVKNSDIPKYEKLQLFADMCRLNTFVSVKKAGSGHLGSSFSAMDVVTYLYLQELNVIDEGIGSDNRDIYFSSKGHDVPGLYSVFYALGLLSKEKFLGLRRLGGTDGHPEVRIPGIEANSGSLGMGISKGKGMAWAKKYKNFGGKVYVLTGDGEFQEGQIYESLQAAAHQKINNLTVIIDRNKFQTDMLVDEVNSIENLWEKVSAFGWHVSKMDGHNFADIEKTIESLKQVTDRPKFIIADTIKGKGISFMEARIQDETGKTFYKWHSGAPDDEHFSKGADELRQKIQEKAKLNNLAPVEFLDFPVEAKGPSGVTPEFVKEAYGQALLEQAEKREDLIVLDGDLSADCGLRPFENKYPDRFIENGIAEQDMASMAGGLARMGLLPVVNSFASFLAARANEQIYNNACEETKIIYTCHFAGLIPAGPGKSHQSVRDISLLGALPNCIIIQPCNGAETKMAVDYCVSKAAVNCALRLVIGPSPRNIALPEGYVFEEGAGAVLRPGNDSAIFAYGPVMLHEALLASEILGQHGYGLRVINMPWLNRVNIPWLRETISGLDNIFVLEGHSTFGGLGDSLLSEMAENDMLGGIRFRKLGIKGEYPECGTPQEVLKYHKLDGESLARGISGIKDIGAGEEKGHYTDHAPQ